VPAHYHFETDNGEAALERIKRIVACGRDPRLPLQPNPSLNRDLLSEREDDDVFKTLAHRLASPVDRSPGAQLKPRR